MRLRERWRVARRKRELEYLLAYSRHTSVAWIHELHYIKQTGRLDWVNRNMPKVHPAGAVLKPPMPQPR